MDWMCVQRLSAVRVCECIALPQPNKSQTYTVGEVFVKFSVYFFLVFSTKRWAKLLLRPAKIYSSNCFEEFQEIVQIFNQSDRNREHISRFLVYANKKKNVLLVHVAYRQLPFTINESTYGFSYVIHSVNAYRNSDIAVLSTLMRRRVLLFSNFMLAILKSWNRISFK